MSLTVTILGCGTSSGVPRIGNDWGACDPGDPRNQRTRASILVESRTTRILVDTSPDMRAQLLAANVVAVDAILWTHDHADHSHGIDDVRQLFHLSRRPIAGYARRETLDLLQRRFGYVFDGRDGYPPTVEPMILPDRLTIGDIDIACVDQPHGTIWSTGFLFHCAGLSAGYSTDFHEVTNDMLELFARCDLWVVDALRQRPHPTHATLGQALDAIATARPKQALLTHMDQSMDFATVAADLPEGVAPAFDGQRIIMS